MYSILPIKQNMIDRRCAAARVLAVVVDTFGIEPSDLRIGCRKQVIVAARSVFCFACHKFIGCSMPDLAKLLSANTHGFVVVINKKVIKWIKASKVLPTNAAGKQVSVHVAVRRAYWAAMDILPDTLADLAEYPMRIRQRELLGLEANDE